MTSAENAHLVGVTGDNIFRLWSWSFTVDLVLSNRDLIPTNSEVSSFSLKLGYLPSETLGYSVLIFIDSILPQLKVFYCRVTFSSVTNMRLLNSDSGRLDLVLKARFS